MSLIDSSPIPLLQRAIKIDKNYHQAYGRLAECYLAKGKFKKAFDSVNRRFFSGTGKTRISSCNGEYISFDQPRYGKFLKAYRKARDLGSTHPATMLSVFFLRRAANRRFEVVRQLLDQYAENLMSTSKKICLMTCPN